MQIAQLYDRVELDRPIAGSEIDRSAFIGEWINSNHDTTSIPRLKIFEADGRLKVQVFAIGPDGLNDWGAVDADVFAAGPASRTGAGLQCRYDLGSSEVRLQGMLMKGLLVLAQFHMFRDDSNRDSFLREYYGRLNG